MRIELPAGWVPPISSEQLDAVEQKARVDDSIVRSALMRIPAGWRLEEPSPSGGWFRRGRVQVGFSVLRYGDGRIWLHVSACRALGRNRLELCDWEELKRVKHDFIGPDRWAYQVLPSQKDYVNHNPAVLHLFSLLEGEPALPDFTWGLGTL